MSCFCSENCRNQTVQNKKLDGLVFPDLPNLVINTEQPCFQHSNLRFAFEHVWCHNGTGSGAVLKARHGTVAINLGPLVSIGWMRVRGRHNTIALVPCLQHDTGSNSCHNGAKVCYNEVNTFVFAVMILFRTETRLM
jgi:hypothetical protein